MKLGIVLWTKDGDMEVFPSVLNNTENIINYTNVAKIMYNEVCKAIRFWSDENKEKEIDKIRITINPYDSFVKSAIFTKDDLLLDSIKYSLAFNTQGASINENQIESKGQGTEIEANCSVEKISKKGK